MNDAFYAVIFASALGVGWYIWQDTQTRFVFLAMMAMFLMFDVIPAVVADMYERRRETTTQ